MRATLNSLMEGRLSLLSWKEEHGHEGHTAERAVYAAGLALFVGDRLSEAQYVDLVRPLAEALPWLPPETPPTPRFDLKYSNGTLSHDQLMSNIELYGREVIPRVRELLAAEPLAA